MDYYYDFENETKFDPMFNPFMRNVTSISRVAGCKVLALPPPPMFGNEIGGFSSIVETLLIDILIFLGVLILFTIISKIARKDRYASESTDLNWLQLFYGDTNADLKSCDIDPGMKVVLGNPEGYFYWLRAVFHLRDKDYLNRSGLDAVAYLSFQRYIIVLSLIITVLCTAVVIPVSFMGIFEGKRNAYARTTIANVNTRLPIIWFYPVMGFVFFAIGLLFLKSYGSTTLVLNRLPKDKRTVIVKNIAENDRTEEILELFFMQVFPHVRVDDIQLVYNVQLMTKLNQKRLDVESCLEWCRQYTSETQERPRLIPYICGSCLSSDICCCFCSKVDAIDYYTRQKIDLLTKMREEKIKTMEKPLDLAYVTFETVNMLHYVLANKNEQKSRVKSKELAFAFKWKLKESPEPQNILWHNLHASRVRYWVVSFLLFSVYLAFVFFLSTPNVVLNILGLEWQKGEAEIQSSFTAQYIPSFLLLVLSSTFPLLVAYSGQLIPYLTKSDYYFAMMIKTFGYLLIMIVVLPLTEFTSIMAFIREAAVSNGGLFRWDCVFLPDNGVFFTSFLIHAGFLGISIKLLRVPELVKYTLLTMITKSRAELVSIRKAVKSEFEFGLHYAFYLVNFCVIIIFSTAVPLVVPLGLIYLINKHLVDRYNIFFANSPSQVDNSVHIASINLAIFAFVLQQLFMTVYSFIRGGYNNVFAVYLAGLLITLLIFLVQVWVPDISFLRLLALPHTRRLMKRRQSIKVDVTRHKDRAWSCYEVEEQQFVVHQDYKPEVLQMEYEPETIRVRHPNIDRI